MPKRCARHVSIAQRCGLLLALLVAPVPSTGAVPGDARPARIVASVAASEPRQPPLFYRRLLTSAVARIAPRFWEGLRARGPAAVSAWFESRAKLDPELVAEAHEGAGIRQAPPGSAGPPLAAALKFVETYVDLARCAELPPDARGGCGRARQLQELLETSAALVVERRIESIWATDCRSIGPDAVLDWLQEFPSSQQRLDDAQWARVSENAHTKLQTCFLGDAAATASAAAWVGRKLPSSRVLTGPALARVSRVRQRWSEDGDEELCGRAVRALQRMPQPAGCELPAPVRHPLAAWLAREASPKRAPATPTLQACTELLSALWQGRAASVPPSFARPPAADEIVEVADGFAPTPVSRLRALCDERRGDAFPATVGDVASVAAAFGERVDATPWRVEREGGQPLEQARFGSAARFRAWVANLFVRTTPCEALALPPDRCATCGGARAPASFDCELLRKLEGRWGRWHRILWRSATGLVVGALLLAWAGRTRSARRRFGSWSRHLRSHLESISLRPTPDRWSWLLPSRLQHVAFELPAEPAWDRWGRRAVVHRGEGGARVLDGDVNRAALRARAGRTELAILAHDAGASPDLAAVRAVLEWGGRGSGRAVHVVPMPVDRLQWLRGPEDLLDAVEQGSARGNPFELRGRVTSASQFFDRERLVSGLLADVEAGNWVFVGGLRRFGKSSLALEVARRLPAPSAYVDLAAFHHEITSAHDAAATADSILRYASVRLHEAAVARYGAAAAIPARLPPDAPIGAAEITGWYRAFALACAHGEGHRPEPMLLVLDELEQAIGTDAERLPRALEVLSIMLGRLRGAFRDPAVGATRAGVLLCGALHPVLWAPVPALAGQSMLGAFQTVFVPRLPDDAAHAMMRALGARQGIRFTDAALKLIVDEGRGVPLLVRRLASSVLDLYDPERARQGALGAVEIGIEGASAAVRREEEPGSPLRVWVESEIADPQSVPGALLRRLAREGRMTRDALRARAVAELRAQFVAVGIDRLLSPDEQVRRAAEAAGVVVRMLGETGLLTPEGNPTSPDAYLFVDGLLRRILAADAGSAELAI